MESVIKLRRYINSDKDPVYVSRNEYEILLFKSPDSKILLFNEPELLTPALDRIHKKPIWIKAIDVILRKIDE
jgi:hypothetical protein